jgi:hypothetical protein
MYNNGYTPRGPCTPREESPIAIQPFESRAAFYISVVQQRNHARCLLCVYYAIVAARPKPSKLLISVVSRTGFEPVTH